MFNVLFNYVIRNLNQWQCYLFMACVPWILNRDQRIIPCPRQKTPFVFITYQTERLEIRLGLCIRSWYNLGRYVNRQTEELLKGPNIVLLQKLGKEQPGVGRCKSCSSSKLGLRVVGTPWWSGPRYMNNFTVDTWRIDAKICVCINKVILVLFTFVMYEV